jgi:hypothetical protein
MTRSNPSAAPQDDTEATDAATRDEIISVPTAQRYWPAGYYPSSYRIAYDAEAKEYRVALTQLRWRN